MHLVKVIIKHSKLIIPIIITALIPVTSGCHSTNVTNSSSNYDISDYITSQETVEDSIDTSLANIEEVSSETNNNSVTPPMLTTLILIIIIIYLILLVLALMTVLTHLMQIILIIAIVQLMQMILIIMMNAQMTIQTAPIMLILSMKAAIPIPGLTIFLHRQTIIS